MEKMTIVKALDYVLDNYGAELPTDVSEKLESIKQTAQNKKNSRKGTSKADEPETIVRKEQIMDFLTENESHYSATQLYKALFADDEEMTPNKVTYLLGLLKNEGLVDKTKAKGIVVFTKA